MSSLWSNNQTSFQETHPAFFEHILSHSSGGVLWEISFGIGYQKEPFLRQAHFQHCSEAHLFRTKPPGSLDLDLMPRNTNFGTMCNQI